MSDIRVTTEQVDAILAESTVEAAKLGEKTTVVAVTLPCGFVIVTSSSCIDPKNYSHSLGTSLCLKRAADRLWELEGYRVQSF